MFEHYTIQSVKYEANNALFKVLQIDKSHYFLFFTNEMFIV